MADRVTDSNLDTPDTYDNAADYIEKHGWTQETLRSHGGKVCLVGAIRATNMETYERNQPAMSPVISRLRRLVGAPHDGYQFWTPITEWNDSPQRTEQEVLDLLRRAAKDAAE